MALGLNLKRYTILKVDKKEELHFNSLVFSVTYRDNFSGVEQGWTRNVNLGGNLDQASSLEIKKSLLEDAAFLAGPELVEALSYWFKWEDKQYDFSPQWKEIGYTTDASMVSYQDFTNHYEFPLQPKGWAKTEITANLLSGAINPVSDPASLSHMLPGITERVSHPALKVEDHYPGCTIVGNVHTIRQLVMHLNDDHKWTREEIADWLDTLDVDLAFKSPEDVSKEKKRKELDQAKAMMVDYEKQMKSTAAALEALKANAEKCADNIKKLQEELNVQD